MIVVISNQILEDKPYRSTQSRAWTNTIRALKIHSIDTLAGQCSSVPLMGSDSCIPTAQSQLVQPRKCTPWHGRPYSLAWQEALKADKYSVSTIRLHQSAAMHITRGKFLYDCLMVTMRVDASTPSQSFLKKIRPTGNVPHELCLMNSHTSIRRDEEFYGLCASTRTLRVCQNLPANLVKPC